MAAGCDAKPTQRAQGLPLKALFSHWSLAPSVSVELEKQKGIVWPSMSQCSSLKAESGKGR